MFEKGFRLQALAGLWARFAFHLVVVCHSYGGKVTWCIRRFSTLRGRSFRNWRESLMSFVTAYFDESNTHIASAVAGIIGEADQLDRMNDEWSEMLDREGLHCFHMKDFAHSRGEFESWKNDEP